jgi:hypothetical protein
MSKSKLFRSATILGAVVIIGAAAISAGPTFAAKGGKGGHQTGGGTASLTVTPNPLPAYTQPTVSGTGFGAGETVFVGIPGDVPYTTVTADGTGAFTMVYTRNVIYVPYTYTMEALSGGSNGIFTVRASTTFVVQ